jgi:hypothetical protein
LRATGRHLHHATNSRHWHDSGDGWRSHIQLQSVDLYASLVPIPYQITGRRNSTTVFTLANTLPNTFGDFATVVNPQASAVIDTLVISLTDGVSAMGLDNIVLAAN